jgi:putative transposase
MRYPYGGVLTARGRSRREQVRLEAAEMFAQDADARQIAPSLRESTKSVYQWRCALPPAAGLRTSGGLWPGSRR